MTSVCSSGETAGRELLAQLIADALMSAPAMLGSLDLLGNPTAFLSAVFSSGKEVLSSPATGLLRLPFAVLAAGLGSGRAAALTLSQSRSIPGAVRGVLAVLSLLLQAGEGVLRLPLRLTQRQEAEGKRGGGNDKAASAGAGGAAASSKGDRKKKEAAANEGEAHAAAARVAPTSVSVLGAAPAAAVPAAAVSAAGTGM